jgi:hypothetical protein
MRESVLRTASLQGEREKDRCKGRGNGICRNVSYPKLVNNLFWPNRAFHLEVGGFGTGLQTQQHLVTLIPTLNQTAMGSCMGGAHYWDIGVRGDTGPADHSSGFTLNPSTSIFTSLDGGYNGNGNLAPANAGLVSQYCNGSRVPPENGGLGYNVPPGVADATLPNPVFNLTPSATVDEGNNWVNMSYGPLTLTNLLGATLRNYAITSGSPARSAGLSQVAPSQDFFGNPRPQSGVAIGAVQFSATPAIP